MNLELIKARAQIVKLVRRWFDEQGFLEMHTPRLVGLPGQEPYLEPMWSEVTEANGSKHQAALITSPEYAMKKLLAAGLDNIYDLGPCFRDGEPWDGSHDPEFLMLEWYRRDAGLKELFQDTENLIRFVGQEWCSPEQKPAWLDQSFRCITVKDAMKQYANIDLDTVLENREALVEVVRAHGQTVQPSDTWDDLFFKVFLSEVEPNLGWQDQTRRIEQPTFLYNYPASMAALARRDPTDPRYALRTELYIGNLELANGFAELADEKEQRARFEEERELRRSLGKKTWDLDEDFLQSLPLMGNAAGIAFGIERLVMLLTHETSISNLLSIPVTKRFS